MAEQYRVILADPPWAFENTSSRSAITDLSKPTKVLPARRNAARHYQGVMSIDQIKALPVGGFAAKDAALFLWVTMVHLPDAFGIMEAWGFRYRTCAFAWTKLNRNATPFMGLGNYTRANAELCLLGLRGKPKTRAKNVPQALLSRRREHSRKPDEQYDRIMRLFDGPYLEMFARQQWPGWETAFSNQDGKFPAQPFLFGEATA